MHVFILTLAYQFGVRNIRNNRNVLWELIKRIMDERLSMLLSGLFRIWGDWFRGNKCVWGRGGEAISSECIICVEF